MLLISSDIVMEHIQPSYLFLSKYSRWFGHTVGIRNSS